MRCFLWRSGLFQLSECPLNCRSFGKFRVIGDRPGDALSCCFPAAAVVGGVGGPVTSAGALPGDRDADVDAEHAGEQRCGELGGELGGELEQRGGVDECPPTRRPVTPPNSHMVIRGRPVGGGPPALVSLPGVRSKEDEKWT